jgi:LmbE family N-acetylglucosaminyl deacetylase
VTTAGEAIGLIRGLPRGDLVDILKGRTPIVLAPHPDDEVIGCGGLMAASVRAQIAPVIVFVTDGSGSHPNSHRFPRARLIALRQSEAYAAAKILGIDKQRLHFLRIRDTAAPREGPAFTEAVCAIAQIIATYPNPMILASWACDPHGDHQAVHEMAAQVARTNHIQHLSYPVWGWTLPPEQELGAIEVTGLRFRIDGFRDLKARALAAHRSQTSDLIDDDPEGFRLDAEILRTMLSDDEVFLFNR